ncbi:MAG: hypothetical protein CMI31_10790 [Opitutae bacterium]|nr:hypothetical protein [Opitutae bacterium]|tara:strand:- start:327 stop:578 length:252 start_codon:yes stop_codon:yes gene_type:complete
MKWLASPNPPAEFWHKLTNSFPSTWSDTNWMDWAWLAVFLFIGGPLIAEIWKATKKGRKQLIGLLALVVFFGVGWAFVGYFTR